MFLISFTIPYNGVKFSFEEARTFDFLPKASK